MEGRARERPAIRAVEGLGGCCARILRHTRHSDEELRYLQACHLSIGRYTIGSKRRRKDRTPEPRLWRDSAPEVASCRPEPRDSSSDTRTRQTKALATAHRDPRMQHNAETDRYRSPAHLDSS